MIKKYADIVTNSLLISNHNYYENIDVAIISIIVWENKYKRLAL